MLGKALKTTEYMTTVTRYDSQDMKTPHSDMVKSVLDACMNVSHLLPDYSHCPDYDCQALRCGITYHLTHQNIQLMSTWGRDSDTNLQEHTYDTD